MIGQNDQLLTLVDKYLSSMLTLQHVEQWVTGHEAAEFEDWEAELFRRLKLDLAELGSGGLTEAELQAEVREFLSTRTVAPKFVPASQDTSSTTSTNTVFRVAETWLKVRAA